MASSSRYFDNDFMFSQERGRIEREKSHFKNILITLSLSVRFILIYGN